MKLARIKKAAMDGMPPTAVFCVIGSAVVTVKTVIRGIFDGGMTRVLLVPHGGNHNDTICTVEVKR